MSEMENVKQQIFEIEDFENVSDELMAKISENQEYRALFEELRDLSKTFGAAVPMPKKNGETLHDAVMSRVKSGDIAPRYINTGRFRFPVATVACICVFLAVILVSRSGLVRNKMSDNAMEEADVARNGGYYSTYYANDYIGENGVHFEAVYDASDDYADYEAAEEEFIIARDESESESADAAQIETESAEVPEMKKSAEAAVEGAAGANRNSEADVDYEVKKRLLKAEEITGKESIITVDHIAKFGTENYISFFDSIAEKDNFRELYTLENFIAFCENN